MLHDEIIESKKPVKKVKPILRLHPDCDFERINPKIKETILREFEISAWEKDNFEVQFINDENNCAIQDKKRIDSIHEGVKFLLDNMQDKYLFSENLKKSLETEKENYLSELKSITAGVPISIYQNLLTNYVKSVADVLSSQLNLKKDEIIKQWNRAEQYAIALHEKAAIITIGPITDHSDEYMVLIDKPKNPFDEKIISELKGLKEKKDKIIESLQDEKKLLKLDLPSWFNPLQEYEKRFLLHFLERIEVKDLGTVINALSSRLRIIPAPANYSTHQLITLTKNGTEDEICHHPIEYRLSHVASREAMKEVSSDHAWRNTNKVVEDIIKEKEKMLFERLQTNSLQIIQDDREEITSIPILFQTLISPIVGLPDYNLHEEKNAVVPKLQHKLNEKYGNNKYLIISTNHPLNIAKYIEPFTSQYPSAIKVFLDHQFKCEKENEYLFKKICEILKYFAEQSSLFRDYQLYLSSIEDIAVELTSGGVSMGGCVSGKDRKGIQIVNTDAMRIFIKVYKKIPLLSISEEWTQEDEKKFLAIFAQVYCTMHQQAVSSQNAPGSYGIKTPQMYLPDPLLNAIKNYQKEHDYFNINIGEEDILASNNELKDIKGAKNYVYKKLELNFKEIYKITDFDDLIKNAIEVITHYIATIKLGLVDTFFGTDNPKKERHRANAFLKKLNKNQSILEKLTALEDLFKDSEGEKLKIEICKKIKFPNMQEAKNMLRMNIENITQVKALTEINFLTQKSKAHVSHSLPNLSIYTPS